MSKVYLDLKSRHVFQSTLAAMLASGTNMSCHVTQGLCLDQPHRSEAAEAGKFSDASAHSGRGHFGNKPLDLAQNMKSSSTEVCRLGPPVLFSPGIDYFLDHKSCLQSCPKATAVFSGLWI